MRIKTVMWLIKWWLLMFAMFGTASFYGSYLGAEMAAYLTGQ